MQNPQLFKKIIMSKKSELIEDIQEKKEIHYTTALEHMVKYKNAQSRNFVEQNNKNNIINTPTNTNTTNRSTTPTKLHKDFVYVQNSRILNIETVLAQQFYKLEKIPKIESEGSQQNFRISNLENFVGHHKSNFDAIESKIKKLESMHEQQKAKVDNIKSMLEQQINNQNTIISTQQPDTESRNIPEEKTDTQSPIVQIQQSDDKFSTIQVQQQDILDKFQEKIDEQKNKILEINCYSINLNEKLKNIESNVAFLRNLNLDVFTKLKKSCSQICFVIDDIYYTGLGWFYSNDKNDLKNGYFITAAHCVMEIKNNIYYKASCVYIMNPIDNNWTFVNINNIFIDGVGDIALIKTGINFKGYSDYCLKLADREPMIGDICYIVGNSNCTDEDLISMGNVRNPNYCDTTGFQITSSIHVTCPGLGGNTGGPIVNLNGDVIGMYTFGLGGDIENFGAGLNREGIFKSLEILKTSQDNKQKRYLGLDWNVPSPFLIKDYYESNQQFKSCVYINSVCSNSPFYKVLDNGDLLLNAILPSGDIIEFGNCNNQRSPGILIYNYDSINIKISYIKKNQKTIRTETIYLNETYYNVNNIFDGPLQTGLRERQNPRLKNIMKKMQKNIK